MFTHTGNKRVSSSQSLKVENRESMAESTNCSEQKQSHNVPTSKQRDPSETKRPQKAHQIKPSKITTKETHNKTDKQFQQNKKKKGKFTTDPHFFKREAELGFSNWMTPSRGTLS